MEQNKSVENQATTPACKSFKDMVGQPFGSEYMRIAKGFDRIYEATHPGEKLSDLERSDIRGKAQYVDAHVAGQPYPNGDYLVRGDSAEDIARSYEGGAKMLREDYDDSEDDASIMDDQAAKLRAPKELQTLDAIAEGKSEPMSEAEPEKKEDKE